MCLDIEPERSRNPTESFRCERICSEPRSIGYPVKLLLWGVLSPHWYNCTMRLASDNPLSPKSMVRTDLKVLTFLRSTCNRAELYGRVFDV